MEVFLSILLGIIFNNDIKIFFPLLIIFLIYLCLKKYSYKKVLTYFFLMILFIGYSNYKINLYDNKYLNGESIIENYKVISYYDSSDYYLTYICKNTSGDKVLVKIPSGSNIVLNQNDIIYADGVFELPDVSRNDNRF